MSDLNIIREAIMDASNANYFSNHELAAAWGNVSVRDAGFEQAEELGDFESLYKHTNYGSDGLPALGLYAAACNVAGHACHEITTSTFDHSVFDTVFAQVIEEDHYGYEIVYKFLRDPYEGGPQFETALSEIVNAANDVRGLLNDALDAGYEPDEEEDVWSIDDINDTIDALERLVSYIETGVEGYVRENT